MSFSSLYVGATGVRALSENMGVIGNNLANVNTIGYKRTVMHFSDLMSKTMACGNMEQSSGATQISQIGMGVGVGSVLTNFKGGSLESGVEVTDMAIQGNGFFGVRDSGAKEDNTLYYTRAGDFRFNRDAYLVSPHGYRLQGYAVDRESGAVATTASDIQLPYQDVVVDGETTRVVTSNPRATTGVNLISALSNSPADNFRNAGNPFFAMGMAYDGTKTDPFGGARSELSASLNVYDDQGNNHALTVNYDPVDVTTMSNATPGFTYWEFTVSIPAADDGRSGVSGTSNAGLLAMGTMTFNGSGTMVGMSAFELDPSASNAGSLNAWVPTGFASNAPAIDVTFNGAQSPQTISLEFGLRSSSDAWDRTLSNAGNVGTNPAAIPGLAGMTRDGNATTAYSSGSHSLFMDQDGYSRGYLQSLSINGDGFLQAHFTNNQVEDLYQINLYRFTNEYGLRRDGGNMFQATGESGKALIGVSGEGGRGSIAQQALESSNASMEDQFADMIITQRGFQSNTKIITTSEAMLNTTIGIKR